MNKIIILGLTVLLVTVALTFLLLRRENIAFVGTGGQYCCGSFSETIGTTKYYWSKDKNCGVAQDVSCVGSCPSLTDNKFCK